MLLIRWGSVGWLADDISRDAVMLVNTDCHHLASSLFHKHGEDALVYALKNASVLRSANSELEGVWLRVARKIENLISAASANRRSSDD